MARSYLFLKLPPQSHTHICCWAVNMRCLPKDYGVAWSTGVHVHLGDSWNFRQWEAVVGNRLLGHTFRKHASDLHVSLSASCPPWIELFSLPHAPHLSLSLAQRWSQPPCTATLKLRAKLFLPLSYFSQAFVTAPRTYQPCTTTCYFGEIF